MRVNTLLFHDVVPQGDWSSSGFQGADADVYKLDCEEFRRHLNAIPKNLRNAVSTAPELLRNHPIEHPLLITFDDGGVSALTHTAAILEEFGWRGHFFVTAGRIGTPGFLNKGQIVELHQRGHIIGSHSYSHPTRMALCSETQMNDEWQRSVLVLSEILGTPIEIASVPGGFYSKPVASTAVRAGIKVLFNSEPQTTSQTVDGCLVLGRFTLQHGQPPERSAAIARADRHLLLREYLFWNSKKLAKSLFGSAWLKARVMLLERRARK
jgi:peptidoglycan/xylan/chitin deacetylase (PgdA/CDA1 family)